MSEHNDIVYLKHILEACEKIEDLRKRGGKLLFEEDFAIADSMVRELLVIGEAARNVSNEVKATNQDIPWKEMVGVRDWLVHGYAEIDWDKVWDTVENDIPELARKLSTLLK